MVYFATSYGSRLIKIGFASGDNRACLRHRLTSLQTGNPHKLTIVAAMLGGSDLERRLHRQFAEHRQAGEWFTPVDELRELVEKHRIPDLTVQKYKLRPKARRPNQIQVLTGHGNAYHKVAAQFGLARYR